MKNLTNKEIKIITNNYLESNLIERTLRTNLENLVKEKELDYFSSHYPLIKAGQKTINELVESIFSRKDNAKYSKYKYYNVQNVKDYCQEWYFDCFHNTDYSFYETIRLIKDFINGVLEYPKKDKAFKKMR